MLNSAQAQSSAGVPPLLTGVGYFEDLATNGVGSTSLAGGAEIMFYGQGMSHHSSMLQVLFTSSQLNFQAAGPPLTQDNQFQSNTDMGRLQYTTPSFMELHGVSYNDLGLLDWATYDLSLLDYDPETMTPRMLKCPDTSLSNCRLTMSRAYTPILYYLSPPVVYFGSEVSFWVDPRSTQNLKEPTKWPFIESRINGYTIDYEGFIDESITLTGYTRNQVRGRVGNIQPNKSASVNMKFKAGNAYHYDHTMLRCDYSNTTCYKAKVVPVVNYIDALEGYTTGGQLLTVWGFGFSSKDIDVQVDGAPCIVKNQAQDNFQCLTTAKPSPSHQPYYTGQPGLRRKIFNTTFGLSFEDLGRSNINFTEELSMDLEAQKDYKNGNYGNVFSGYFKAPSTAKYRFYMSCDDQCQLAFSKTNMDPSKKEVIFQVNRATSYRGYITLDDSMTSQWMDLTKDEYYFMEVRHVQWGGADHLTVSVEIEDPAITPGHHHTSHEIQRMTINQNLTREQSKITITYPDGGKFVMNIQNPLNNQLWASSQISTNATAAQLQNAIQGFYSLVWGASIFVEKEMFDVNGTVTTDILLASKSVFTIYVQRSLPRSSTNYVNFQKVSTKAQISYRLPRDIQLSSLPLAGSFIIKCALPDGTYVSTAEIGVKNQTYQIRDKINAACPLYKEKYDIWDGPRYGYYEDGRDLLIRFSGLNHDTPQFLIESYTDNPLVGNSVTLTATTEISFNPNRIMYEPVPYDFLFTNETKPQVRITVDGLEAACASLNCGYTYFDPLAAVTGFSYSGTTLTITGVNFPQESEMRTITLGNQQCAITSASVTQIVCTVNPPIAGIWQPIVTDDKGLIPVQTSSTITVPLSITSVTPSTGLNPMGGELLTITGTNLPYSDDRTTQVRVSLSGGSECQVISTSQVQITCITGKFEASTSSSIVQVQINEMSDNSQSVSVGAQNPVISEIIPSKASPVLKSILTIKVQSFPGTLSKSDLSVRLVPINVSSDSFKVRHLNIVELSNINGDKYIKVKYGGAYSGLYSLEVISSQYGAFDTSSLTFEAVGKVTDFQPKQGSLNGGTLITITGYNFSETEITDNPVRVGYTDCLVQTTSNTQITCRTLPRMEDQEGEDDLIVLLKVSEEAEFEVTPRKFEWIKTGLPTVTGFTIDFDTQLKDFIMKIQGTGFGSQLVGTSVLIDDYEQTVLSVQDDEVIVQIVKMKDIISKNVKFYLPIGTPDGMEIFQSMGITLDPKLLSVSPTVGSIGGSLITMSVKGVGEKTMTYLNFVNEQGTELCSKVNMITDEVIQCKAKSQSFTANSLRMKVNGFFHQCIGTNNECNFQTDSSIFPQITGVTKVNDNTLSISGMNLNILTGYTASVKFAGVQAHSVTVDSQNAITATFPNGIPLTSVSGISPELFYLISSDSNNGHWASLSSGATLSNPLIATAISSSVQCSFAGGCKLSIDQSGLYQSVLSNSTANQVKVCGQPCTLDQSNSNTHQYVCSLPALATTYSVVNYNITQMNYLRGEKIFGSNSQQAARLFDGSNQMGWTDTMTNCYFGTSFKEGYVGVLREVKYFMNRFVRTNLVGKLQFQGSNDGVSYTTIFTVGEEIHEGWNYYNYQTGEEPKYRYFRFLGTAQKSCVGVGEIVFRGFEVIDSNADTYSSCPIQAVLNSSDPVNISGTVTYSSTLTPLLHSISPRFGNVKGGDQVTFTGENFSNDQSKYSIKIDGRVCTVTFASTTSVKCITAPRPGLYEDTTLDIKIDGMGSVATQGLLFLYASYWSDDTTWGGEFAPIEGDMVYVPKGLHLLVDVDSTPVLSAVLVEGSLIFPPHPTDANHLRTFDAHYIFVREGYMEVGTEQFPYTSKLVITMHSNKESPEIPIYGNKVIGVRNGILDMHGVPRNPTWTELDTTVLPGQDTISLIRAVDWQVGESIVIAPTDYESTHSEERTITAIDRTNPNKPVITLDSPLMFKHYSGKQTFGTTDFIEMRAEVGLLTRNVVFRGDTETSAQNQFGAHIMLHSMGDESVIGRIEYVELRDVGQAFQLGRYPIHFHMIGTVHNSYVKGNSIHHTYNRAVTIHGVHYLRITDNVAYKTMGHTFFIEDAAETKNYLENNLAINTQRSWSLLNTDQSPASFWITHPDNIFRGNHAAGSTNYGFWFDTKPNPMGPSFDPNVCPENSPLGEFTNNVAHSNGKYGLRIFHNLIPRTNPCSPIIYDPTLKNGTTTDPFWQNPLITARFINFTSFKNQRNGAIAEKVGDVRWENFKVADNLIAGLEFSLVSDVADGYAQINGALVIGRSENAEEATNTAFSHGIITPRSENFQVHNVSFYNFDIAGKAALGSCSHCFHPASTDSGARTITFSNIHFDEATVTRKIRYQYPWRDIFYDLDGTLTGLGPKTWATPYWRHNEQPECVKDLDVYDGLLCNSSIQVRRIVFHNYDPSHFSLMDIKLLPIDGHEWENITAEPETVTVPDPNDPNSTITTTVVPQLNMTEKYQRYLLNTSNYGIIPFKAKLDPTNAWALPIVTGHKYKTHWQYGLDFISMQITLSHKWQPTDKGLYMVLNFTDVREKVEIITAGDTIENMTLLNKTTKNTPQLLQTGDNTIYNDTATREIHLYLNGKNSSRSRVIMKGYRCVDSCFGAIEDLPLETTVRLWSNPDSWPKGVLPREGENVEIKSGWNMIFDIPESPLLNMLEINGLLTFKPDSPSLHLRAKYIFVRSGKLAIGDENAPFQGQAKITLSGEKSNQHIVYTNAIEAGNKILANTAQISMYGIRRSQFSRLLKTANKGDKQIWVTPGLDWKEGDKIGLLPTNMRYEESDYAIITTYDISTGLVTLDRALDYYHFGQNISTGAKYSGVDMRGEVVLLTRNIQIVGNDTEAWGCQVVTSDFMEANGVWRYGNTVLDSVEIYNCSQYDTYKAALRFEGNFGSWSQVSHSSLHHGLGIGAQFTAGNNVLITNNTVFDFVRFGINIDSSSNITIDGNIVANINSRGLTPLDGVVDVDAGILGCAFIDGDRCQDIFILNNIVAGTSTTGYSAYGHTCGDYSQPVFRNNTAHSVSGNGAIIFRDLNKDDQAQCLEGSFFTAYKCQHAGAVSYSSDTQKIIFSNMTLIDNVVGASANVGQEGDNLWALIRNSKFYGETPARDCESATSCSGEGCQDRTALVISYFSKGGKPPMVKMKSALPYHKVKSDASWGGNILYENNLFAEFTSPTTFCGGKQKLFGLNEHGADYHPRAMFTGTIFQNVDQDTVAWLFTPPLGWANMDDCGNFPCTAPSNALLQFERSKFTGGITPAKTQSSFQIIPNNKDNAVGLASCQFFSTWNAYYCNNDNLGILLFESLDDDKMKRMISPITIQALNTTSKNTLNSFMDHIWDGFYTGQLRMSRWPALIQTSTRNTMYEIKYTGTPPSYQRFTLKAEQGSVILRIDYTKPGAYVIKDQNKNLIKANQWDDVLKQPQTIKGDKGGTSCGENRYMGVVNILEFYLKSGCTLFIEPIDSIYASVRMNWTLEGFYSSGGTTQFVDRLAASLGIHASNIKIVSVYQGSVVVQMMIVDDLEHPLNNTEVKNLTGVQEKLQTSISQNKLWLGAPIIGADVKGLPVTIVSNPDSDTTINPYPNTTTPGGSNNQSNPSQPPVIIVQNQTVVQVQTEEAGSQAAMIAAVCIIVALVIVVTGAAFVYYRKHNQAITQTRSATASGVDDIESKQQNVSVNASAAVFIRKQSQYFDKQYHPKDGAEIVDIFNREDIIIQKANDADQVFKHDMMDIDDEDVEDHQGPYQLSQITDHEMDMHTKGEELHMQAETPLHHAVKTMNSFGGQVHHHERQLSLKSRKNKGKKKNTPQKVKDSDQKDLREIEEDMQEIENIRDKNDQVEDIE